MKKISFADQRETVCGFSIQKHRAFNIWEDSADILNWKDTLATKINTGDEEKKSCWRGRKDE